MLTDKVVSKGTVIKTVNPFILLFFISQFICLRSYLRVL